MARLPWHHSRSRTQSGSEKSQLSNAQEWFSRHTSEPSRQALADLVKVHRRENSDESNKPVARSRSSTITSLEWQRGRSRTGSASEDALSRTASPHHSREGSMYSTWDRSEGATKALLAKGGMMLRRTGSKMSLSSAGSSSTLGLASPPRASNSSASHVSARSEEVRTKISPPFDFQHVTHTEQTQFVGLGRIEESELANQFTDAVTGQSAAPRLRGIEASNIDTAKESHALTTDDQSNESNASLLHVPSTSPRPVPPPKDEGADAYIVARDLSANAANASEQSSPRSIGFSPESILAAVDVALARKGKSAPLHNAPNPMNVTTDDVDPKTKPLPELPPMQPAVSIIHAVTTEDNTARAMIATPLPTPPVGMSPGSEPSYFPQRPMHQRQKSSVALPRHMSFYPSAKASMPNLLSANHLSVIPKTLARHHSDVALSQQAKIARASVSPSESRMSFAAIDTMDWEDAVDEAWNAVDDEEDLAMETSFSSFCSVGSVATADARTASSTPLTMAPSRPLPATPSPRPSPSIGVESRKLPSVREDVQQTDLAGLGIMSSAPSVPTPTLPNFSRSSSLQYTRRRSSTYCGAHESLTRSSSQESIIMSIASSIIGTQRSSNSSVCAEDLVDLSKAQGHPSPQLAMAGRKDDEVLQQATFKNARPESGCLPLDILERLTNANATPEAEEAAEAQDIVPPVPPVPQHKHSKSSSKLAVPERRSSVVASGRKRSNTTSGRPRQSARISYSLFPTASPNPPLSS